MRCDFAKSLVPADGRVVRCTCGEVDGLCDPTFLSDFVIVEQRQIRDAIFGKK